METVGCANFSEIKKTQAHNFALLLESSIVLTVFNTSGIVLLFSSLPTSPQVCVKQSSSQRFVSYGNWPNIQKNEFKPKPLCGDKHFKPSTREKKHDHELVR
jgi:hypothetical protein